MQTPPKRRCLVQKTGWDMGDIPSCLLAFGWKIRRDRIISQENMPARSRANSFQNLEGICWSPHSHLGNACAWVGWHRQRGQTSTRWRRWSTVHQPRATYARRWTHMSPPGAVGHRGWKRPQKPPGWRLGRVLEKVFCMSSTTYSEVST